MSRIIRKLHLSLVLFLFLTLAACSNSEPTTYSSEPQNMQQNLMNEIIPVYDAEEQLIVELEHYGAISQTDNGFIYSKLSANSDESNFEMEYYHFDFSQNQSTKLGTIKNWVYEAHYDTIYSDNHIYMLITTGNAYNFDETKNYLYDIDLEEASMSATVLENTSVPYNSMTLTGDKIIIAAPKKGRCCIYEYDIKIKSIAMIKEYLFDRTINTGDAIRHISSDNQYLYLLRLNMATEANVKLYIDVYDFDFGLINSIDITAAVSEGFTNTDGANIELRQLVSHFFVNNGYVYYENFSSTRALFELQPFNIEDKDSQIKMKQVADFDAGFFKAIDSSNENRLSVYFEFFENIIYILDTDARQMMQHPFFVNEKRYSITYMTQNSKEDVLICMGYKHPSTGETLPDRIYAVNLSELH